jgi:hypothetical protein
MRTAAISATRRKTPSKRTHLSRWGDDRSLFLRAFLSFYLPAGTPEQLKSFIELVRASLTDGRTAANPRRAVDDIDIVDLLPKVSVPTIVFHCIHDRVFRSTWAGVSLPHLQPSWRVSVSPLPAPSGSDIHALTPNLWSAAVTRRHLLLWQRVPVRRGHSSI